MTIERVELEKYLAHRADEIDQDLNDKSHGIDLMKVYKFGPEMRTNQAIVEEFRRLARIFGIDPDLIGKKK